MPPKPQINGYSLFIKQEGQRLLEEEMGRPVGIKEAHEKCSRFWAALSLGAKDEWKQRAKNYRHTDDWQLEREQMRQRQLQRKAEEGPQAKKASAQKNKKRPGPKAEEDERKVYSYYAEDDFEAFERKRERDRNTIKEDMLWTSPPGNQEKRDDYIRSKDFFAISAVTYFESTITLPLSAEMDHLFFPAEIGLVRFNLEDGIIGEWTWRVAHGLANFPSDDLYYEALQKSEDRLDGHGIPVQQDEESPEVGGASLNFNWAQILGDIAEKVKGHKRVYVYSKDYNRVQGSLKWLKDKAFERTGRAPATLNEEKVACFEDLVAAYLMFGKMKPNQFEIDQEIDPDKWKDYDLHPHTLCDFHKSINRRSCAIAQAKKLTYALFNYFEEEQTYGIELGRGHIPDNPGTSTGGVMGGADALELAFGGGGPTHSSATVQSQATAQPIGGGRHFPASESRMVHQASGRGADGWEAVSAPSPRLMPPSAFAQPSGGRERGYPFQYEDDLSDILPSEVVSRPAPGAPKNMPKSLPPGVGRGRGSRPPSSASTIAPGASVSQRATPSEFVQWENAAASHMDRLSMNGSRALHCTPGFRMRVEVPQALLKAPELPAKTLLGPGPSNVPEDVNQAQTLPMQGYLHPEFLKVMGEVKEGLQYMFQTRNRLTYAASGTGHAGMESALTNLVEPGDSVLICEHGLWGMRAAEITERQGGVVHKILRPLGTCFTDLGEVETALKTHKPVVMFICHGESSTGVLQPIEGLGDLCHKYDCLLLVDTVASLGAAPFHMDEWGVDCVYSATQKALSCPPGLAPISFSDRALKKIQGRKTKPHSFYLDALWVGNYWNCFDDPPKYHHTAPISLVFALRQAIGRIAKEGLEHSIARHKENALSLHKGLQELGLELFVSDEKLRLPSLTTVKVPEGVNWKAVADHLMQNYKIEMAGGLGATAGKIWRIGLFGYNNSEKSVNAVLPAIKEAIGIQKARV